MTANEKSRVEPLLLLSDSRSSALERVLTKAAERWQQRWSTAVELVRIVPEERRGARAERGIVRTLRVTRGHDVLLYLTASTEDVVVFLGAAIASIGGSAAEAPHGIAGELQMEILRSLCAELIGAGASEDVVIEPVQSRPPPCLATRASRYWSASMVFGASRARFSFSLSPTCIERLVPRPASVASEAAARRRNAIGTATIRLEAVLGEVELSLRDFVQMNPGDVLVLGRALGEAGELITESGARVAGIQLGRADAYRAVSVVKQGRREPLEERR